MLGPIVWLTGQLMPVLHENAALLLRQDEVFVCTPDGVGRRVVVGDWTPTQSEVDNGVWILHEIRDKAENLYGFPFEVSRAVAVEILQNVNGVGPLLAHTIVTGFHTAGMVALCKTIVGKNTESLRGHVRGLGAKRAETLCREGSTRLIVRIAKSGDTVFGERTPVADPMVVAQAATALGCTFTAAAIAKTLKEMPEAPSEEVVRELVRRHSRKSTS